MMTMTMTMTAFPFKFQYMVWIKLNLEQEIHKYLIESPQYAQNTSQIFQDIKLFIKIWNQKIERLLYVHHHMTYLHFLQKPY